MKHLVIVCLLTIFMGCNKRAEVSPTEKDSTIVAIEKPIEKDTVAPTKLLPLKHYSNARFREVTVSKTGDNQFRVRGQGQIFEASFSWIIEDGHNELQSGHQMTDAGAPEWGNFDFTITAKKERENSALTLILFEISAKDGSRQHELLIPLNNL